MTHQSTTFQIVKYSVYFLCTMITLGDLPVSQDQPIFPYFAVIKTVLFVGWLKIATTIRNPFGGDSADFQVNNLIARHIRVRTCTTIGS